MFSFYSKSYVTSLLSEPQKAAQRLSSQNPQTGQTSVQGEGLSTPTSNDCLPLGQAKGTPRDAEAGVPPPPTVQHQRQQNSWQTLLPNPPDPQPEPNG